MRTMRFIAFFTLCGLLFNCEMYSEASADGASPIVRMRSEIVFVDTGVANHEQLLADLQVRYDAHRRFNVYVLDRQQNGIDQISKVLAGYRGVDAIHVLSHGADGAVQLGNTWLEVDHLDAHARTVASWRAGLSRDADVFFYGCNVASSQRGRTFIQTVSTLTGADVAASANETGHTSLGGDWALEYAVGHVEAGIAPSRQWQTNWVSVLDMATFQEGFNAYTSTQDTELNSVAPGTIHGTNAEIELDNSPQRVGLIRFDNIFGSGPNQIPFGSVINSATLTVGVTGASVPGANITLHRMLTDWDETSTWTSMGGGIQLDDVEANFLPDSTLPNPDQLGSQTFSGLQATLQAWSNSSPNRGWVMVNDNDQPWKFYASEEFVSMGLRPLLTVDYTPAIVVTNTNNSGTGSLRQAILDANALGGTDTITFNIPLTDLKHHYYRNDGIVGSLSVIATTALDDASITDFDPDYPGGIFRSWYTIAPNSALPDIDDPVILDATTQPGYVDAPIIELDGSGILSNDSGLSLTAGNSTVRGLVINRFNGHGMVLAVGDNNLIEGNYIGTDVSGTIALGNGQQGIQISNTSGHTIGGTSPGAGNVISGNASEGVQIIGFGTSGNTVAGNYIGTDPSGTIAVPNGWGGIFIEQGAANNTIGGTVAGSDNVIAFNSGDGVKLADPTTDANVIQGNSIFSNAGLGIDLNMDGVTSNDDGDADSGPNNGQNFPALTSANTDGVANLHLGGVINSTALRTFRVEFFANSAVDPSGHGEGETYLGFTMVTTDLLGDKAFSTILPAIVPVGSFITATATDPITNDTSEFSPHVPALDMYQVVVDTTNDMADAPDLSSITALLSNRGSDNLISLREAILATNATSNGATPDEIRFNIPDIDPNHFYYQDDSIVGVLSTVFVTVLDDLSITDFDPDYPGPGYSWFSIQPGTNLPAINDAVILDGTTQPGFSGKPIIELDGTLASGSDGLVVDFGGSGTTIRGLVINRFGQTGIWIQDADGNKIEGNYIGTDVSGTLDRGNTDEGVSIDNSDGNTIGGSAAATRNLISGNDKHGIIISSGSTGNVVSGNFIGVDVTGTVKRGNSGDGINISTSSNTIGGIVPGSGNVISGNGNDGININSGTATGNVVYGNVIGSDLSGAVTTLGNSNNGITIQSSASNNTIGGTTAGESNLIAFNTVGVAITGLLSDRNQVRGNSMYSNTGLGIDLNDNGPTLNDPGDGDGGANNFLNYPLITSAMTNEVDTITISGTLNSLDETNFDLDFFYTDAEGGEGQVYLGSISVSTNDSGNASFNNIAFAPIAVPDTAYITATATVTSGSETGNTSEFSEDFQATITNNQPPTASIPAASYPIFENTPSDLHLIGMSVSDPDAGTNDVLATLSVGEGILTVSEGSTGVIVGGSGTGSVTLDGMLAEINDVLSGNLGATIVYTALDDPGLSTNLTLAINDLGHSGSGGPMSDNDTATLNITAENDDPSNTGTLPTDVVVTEDVATQVNLSAINLSDVDAGSANLTMTFSTGTGGTLSATGSGGVTVGGSGTGTLTLDGTAAALNTFLDDPTNIQFLSAPNAAGDDADSLTINVTDNGNTGSGGGGIIPLGSVNVDITSVGDTPQAASVLTVEDTQSGAIVLDRNSNDGVEVTHFRISNITGGTLYHTDGSTVIADGTYITVAEGNTGLKFIPSPDSTTPGSFNVESSEDGVTVAAQSGVATSTITITPVGDTPQAASIVTFEDMQSGAIVLDRNANDGAEVTHFRISNILNGTLYHNDGVTVINSGDFIVVAQGQAGLKFTPSPDSTTPGSFNVESSEDGSTVAGQSGVATSTITVTPVGDTPQAASIVTLEDTQSGAIVLDRNANDGVEVTHFRISNIAGGTLYHNDGSTVISSGAYILFAQGNVGLRFTPSPNSTAAGSFDVEASEDGSTVAAQSGVATSTITVTPVNDAPVLDNTGTMTLTDVIQDSANPPGNSVASIISSAGGDPITDIDSGAVEGIAVIGVDDANGTWEYSTDGGSIWQSFVVNGVADGATDDTSAVLLDDTALVRFVPTPSYTGPAGDITFHAWDQTSGTSGDNGVNASVQGGTSAYSIETEMATLSVVAVSGVTNFVPGAQTIDEDASLLFSSGNGNLIAVDDGSGADPVLQTSLSVTSGTLTLATTTGLTFEGGADGTSAMTISGLESAINTALDGLSYDPNSDYHGPETLQVTTNFPGGLLAHYSFDNIADPGNDDSPGGAHDGTVNGGAVPAFDPVRGGNVMPFDGTNDYVHIPGLIGNPSNITLAAWVNMDAGFLQDELISLGDNVFIRLDEPLLGPGVVGSFHDGLLWQSTASNTFIAGTGWHHIAYTVDTTNNEQVLYIDGIPVATDNYAGSISYGLGTETYIGRHGTFTSSLFFLHGKVDDAMIFDYALTATEIASLFAGGSGAIGDTDNIAMTVMPVGDTPSVTNASTLEDTQTTSGLVISRHAADGPEVTHFRISNITGGTLYHTDGSTVIADGTYITVAQGTTGLKFTPSPDSSTPGSFNVESSEDGFTVAAQSGIATATITVTPVGDTPSVTNASTFEDGQTTSGLAITRHPSDGAEVTHFKITTITGGTLYHTDGVTAISSGDFITVSQGATGLKFTPSPDSTTPGSFNAESSEDGLTVAAQSGVATATITVIPVGDTPQAGSVVTFEDTQSGAIVLDRHVNDGAEVTHFRISNIVGGTLYHSDGLTVVNDGVYITVAEGTTGLKFTPSPDSTTPGSVDAESSEDGLTVAAQSGVATATITVIPVGDTPQAASLVTFVDMQSGPLVLDRSINDGAEVTHFRISNIVGGTLYHSDGLTVVNDGDFITVAQGQAGLRFTPTMGSTTPGHFDVESSEDGTTVAAQSGVATATITIITTSSLWLSTEDDVASPSQAPGLDSWGQDQVLAFDDPNFNLEPGMTDGTLYPVLDLDQFTQDGDADVKGLHYVSQDITVGGNFFPAIDLFTGDLLLIVDSNETLDGTGANLLSVTAHDVFVFRPDVVGDYSAGTFLLVLQDPSGDPLNSISLVENLTLVGDVTLDKGTFIFSQLNNDDDTIYHFDTDDVGANTSGFVSVLLDGSEFGLDQPVVGLDLVEQSLMVGGTALQAGTLLVTLESDDGTVGTANPISTKQQDLFYLDVTTTSMGSGTSAATATLLLEGNDAGLNTNAEDLDAVTLLATVVNNAPTALNSAVNAMEDVSYPFTISDFNFSDVDGGSLTLLRIKTVETTGDLELSGTDVTVAQVISATDITAGNLKFIPDPDANGSNYATFEFYVHDGIEYSDNSYTMTIHVAEQADTPSVTSTTTDEDTQSSTGLVIALNAADGEGVTHFKITAISGGVLYHHDGITTIRSGDFITFAEGDAGLKFTPAANSTADGSFNVQATTTGQDSGLGGGTATATIHVSPINDGPSATIALASYAASEGTPLALHGTGLSVDDLDAGTSTVRVTLSVGEGNLTATAGSTGVAVSGSGSGSVTFEGTLTQINDLLAGHLGATIIYDASVATDTVLTLTIDDLGARGAGGLLTATDTATLTIEATAAGDSDLTAIHVSHNAIDENTDTRSGYRIGMLTTDLDSADTFAYTIVGGADAAKFSIGGVNSNELILTDGLLDHETTSSYNVTVRVIGSGGLTHDETLTITVTDLVAVITVGQSLSVSETAADGALIGTVETTGDIPITFTITGGNVNNAFAIDASGTITVADSSALDFDTTSSYTLTIEVSDGTTSVSETVTITVTDVAEPSSSSDSGPISNPPSAGEVDLTPDATPDVNPEGNTPESVSEDSSISNPTPAEDGSPEPQAPNSQVSNPPTPNPQAPSRSASAPLPTRLGTGNDGFIPGRNSERVDTPAPTSVTSVKRTDAETLPIAVPPETDDLRPLVVAEGLLQELDGMRDEIGDDGAFSQVVVGSTLAFASSLSIGYVLWLIRGGLLLSSLLSSLPAWRFVDPLPVLAHLDASAKEDETEDDSLEAVLQKGADVANAQPESISRMNVERDVDQPRGPHRT